MHLPPIAYPVILLALTFLPVWLWPRYWLAALLTAAWVGIAFLTYPSAEAFMRIAGIGAVAFAIVAWRKRKAATAKSTG